MRMTKEVKDFAIQEFKKRNQEKRAQFYAPFTTEKERYQKWATDLAKEINELIQEWVDEYKTIVRLRMTVPSYSDEPQIGFEVSLTRPLPKFEGPDELKFLAELSTEESLEDLTKLLDKYFA
jgi:hypothetical protein